MNPHRNHNEAKQEFPQCQLAPSNEFLRKTFSNPRKPPTKTSADLDYSIYLLADWRLPAAAPAHTRGMDRANVCREKWKVTRQSTTIYINRKGKRPKSIVQHNCDTTTNELPFFSPLSKNPCFKAVVGFLPCLGGNLMSNDVNISYY